MFWDKIDNSGVDQTLYTSLRNVLNNNKPSPIIYTYYIELGPLKYLAETTGKEMGTVVNWFLLLIVFVFDPLAIAMVIAANFAFAQIKPKEDLDIPKEVSDMREPLGEWADKEIVIEDEEPLITEEEIKEDLNEGTDREEPKKEELKKDIYQEKPKPPNRSSGYWF